MKRNSPVMTGLCKTDAFRILGSLGISYRISEEDGVIYNMGSGFKENRINLYIKNGIIVDFKFY